LFNVVPFFFDSSSVNAAYAGGTGTVADPFQISNWGHLYSVRDNLTKNFTLIADLDSSTTGYSTYNSGAGWTPIGVNTAGNRFIGTFDGDNYTISDLYIYDSTGVKGLFGALETTATVKNLEMIDASVRGGTDTACLIGANYGTVRNVTIAGNVTGASGAAEIGGMIGSMWNGNVYDCSFTGAIIASQNYIGGFVGRIQAGNIYRSRSQGSVTVTGSSLTWAGGFTGYMRDYTIQDCYSNSIVSGIDHVGGFSGRIYQGKLIRCYSNGSVSGTGANIGGLVGSRATGGAYADTNNFWDNQTSGYTTSLMGTGKYTSVMKTMTTFSGAGWNISLIGSFNYTAKTSIWFINNSNDYPRLWHDWIPVLPPPAISPAITGTDPVDTSQGVSININNFSADISHPSGWLMNITIGYVGGHTHYSNKPNGTYYYNFTSAFSPNTVVTMFVNASNGTTYINESFIFTTEKYFYVSYSGGNDANTGLSTGSPWKTITKVNTASSDGTIGDGDNIYFKRGDTFLSTGVAWDGLKPTVNGKSMDNPVVLGAYGTGAKPIIDARRITLPASAHNITIEYIWIKNITSTSAFAIYLNSYCRHIVIQNVDIYSSYDSDINILANCSHIIIRNCTVDMKHIGNDVIHGAFSYGLIENNVFADAKHTSIMLYETTPGLVHQNVIIRNNTFSGPHRVFETYMNKVLFENNICIKYYSASTAPAAEQFCGNDDLIFRFNTVSGYYQNAGNFLNTRQRYDPGSGNIPCQTDMSRLSVYQNTFYTLNQMFTGNLLYDDGGILGEDLMQALYNSNNQTVKNNIMYAPYSSNRILRLYRDTTSSMVWDDLYYDNNIVYVGASSSDTVVAIRYTGSPLYRYTLSAVHIPGWAGAQPFESWVTFTDNTRVDPLFVDAASDDFTLHPTSPAIDSGKWLTNTTTSSTSSYISVNTAYHFWPRIQIHDQVIPGDDIFVGNDHNLEVLGVYTNKTILVNRSITYVIGDNVSLSDYVGDAPDMGAYEFDIYPTITNPFPSDDDVIIAIPVHVTAYAFPYNETHKPLNVYFRTNASGSWVTIGSNLSVDGGIYHCIDVSDFTGFDTYWWSVNVTDSVGLWNNETYSFTVDENGDAFGPAIIRSGMTYNIGTNTKYSTLSNITFDYVSRGALWISLNGIGFNVTFGGTRLYNNISSINSDPLSSTGWIINWTQQHYTESIQATYDISGLKASYDYILYSNASFSTITTTGAGVFSFVSAVWATNRNYAIYDPGIPGGIFVCGDGNYLGKTGNDATGTGTYANPYHTIRKAINASTTSDTIYLLAGEYNHIWRSSDTAGSKYGILINRSGTSSDYYTISGYPVDVAAGYPIIIDATGYLFAKGYGPLCIGTTVATQSYIRISNIQIENVTDNGIGSNPFSGAIIGNYDSGGGSGTMSHIRIDNVTVNDVSGNCFLFWNERATDSVFYLNNITVENCTIDHIAYRSGYMGEGITFKGIKDFVFKNNRMTNCWKTFFIIARSCRNGLVYDNTFYNDSTSAASVRHAIYLATQSSLHIHNVSVYNNMMYGCFKGAICLSGEESGTIDNCSFYNNILNLSDTLATHVCRGIYLDGAIGTTFKVDHVYFKFNTISIKNEGNCVWGDSFVNGNVISLYFANNIFQGNDIIWTTSKYLIYNPSSSFAYAGYHFVNNLYNHTRRPSNTYWSDGTGKFEASKINASAQFVDRNGGDFHLNITSPCIGAASATYTAPFDYEYLTRPQDTTYDIGAYEYDYGTPESPSFTFTGVSPVNNSIGVSLTPTMQIIIQETHGYKFSYNISENTTGTWVIQTSGTNVNNGTYSHAYHNATANSQTYWWKVQAWNGSVYHTEIYKFTTLAVILPSFTFTGLTPANTSTGIALQPFLIFTIQEAHGYKFNYTIYENTLGWWNDIYNVYDTNNDTDTIWYFNANAYSTTYYWRITAWNGTNPNQTSIYYFTTLAASAVDITLDNVHANWTTLTSINITWSKGADCTNTYILKKVGSYPSSFWDPAASLIYTGTNSYYNDTLLDPSIRYHYALFPYHAPTTTHGNQHNVSLAETNICLAVDCGPSWIDFKGYMITDHSIQVRFYFSEDIGFTGVSLNETAKRVSHDTVTGAYSDTDSKVHFENRRSQSFLVGADDFWLTNITVKLRRPTGYLPGMIYCYLYAADANHYPTGAVLSSGSRDGNSISTSGEWFNITMSLYELTAATQYCIVLASNCGSFNAVNWYYDSAHLYADGKAALSTDDGASWGLWSNTDFLFRVYGSIPTGSFSAFNTDNQTVSSTGLFIIEQASLNPGQLYYYQVRANDTMGNMTRGNVRYTLTNPDVPTFLTMIPSYYNSSLYISWIKGNGANTTLVVDGGSSYPSDETDGTVLYNGTGSSAWITGIDYNTTYSLSLFSYAAWADLYRYSIGSSIPWGGISFNCYNESSGLPIGFSVLISDREGNHVYYGPDLNGFQFVNITEIPLGTQIGFYVTNSSGLYKGRMYYFNLINDIFYNLSFYLPMTDTPPAENRSYLYVLNVFEIVESDAYTSNVPVADAGIIIKRYVPLEDAFIIVASLLTDSYGSASVNLYPETWYKIYLNKTGYYDVVGDDYIPDPPNEWGQTTPKSFKLVRVTVSLNDTENYTTPETRWTNIIWSIEPHTFYHQDSFTVYFNISSSDSKLEWFAASLYVYDNTNITWTLLDTENNTDPAGGSISFTIPNATGKYSFECAFKKENFSMYHFGGSDGCRFYFISQSPLQEAAMNIPDLVYLVIMIFLSIAAIAFLVKFGAGALSGIGGLCVMAIMIAIKPDLTVGSPGVPAWGMFLVTAAAYIIVLFISRGKT